MAKTQVCLYIESEIKDMAKSKGINLSEFCENALKMSLNYKEAPENKDIDQLVNNIKELETKYNILPSKIASEKAKLKVYLDKKEKERSDLIPIDNII